MIDGPVPSMNQGAKHEINCPSESISAFFCSKEFGSSFFISDEVPLHFFYLSFQVLHSRYITLPCLGYFACCFPLEGSIWIKVLTSSHYNVGWKPSFFSSDARSAQWLLGLKLGLNCVREGRNVF